MAAMMPDDLPDVTAEGATLARDPSLPRMFVLLTLTLFVCVFVGAA